MKHFNTLPELYAAANGRQINAQEILNRRANIDGEWQDFTVSDELSAEINDKIVELLGGHGKTMNAMRRVLRYSTPQHWGLGRIFLESYGGENPRFRYCAGQDYPAELQQIRKYLTK